jgi:orotate phosphoribosyltransferase
LIATTSSDTAASVPRRLHHDGSGRITAPLQFQQFIKSFRISHRCFAGGIFAHVGGWLADKLGQFDCDTVTSPALGGIIVGQEVGRSLGKCHIFVEKEDGKLVLRRGFQISANQRFIVVEDVVTRDGRVQETIDIVPAHGGIVSAVGVIVDRSGATKPDFGSPFISLIEMNFETFPADNLPSDLAKIPAVKPGSK